MLGVTVTVVSLLVVVTAAGEQEDEGQKDLQICKWRV